MDEDRLRTLFQALAAHRVEYAVFGAVALGLHGLARATADLDLFVPVDRGHPLAMPSGRRHFDDPHLGRLDWDGLRDRYAALLPRISTREELNDLIGQLIAELGIIGIGKAFIVIRSILGGISRAASP